MNWEKSTSLTGFTSYHNKDNGITIKELVNKWGEPSVWGVWEPPNGRIYRANSLEEAKEIAVWIAKKEKRSANQ